MAGCYGGSSQGLIDSSLHIISTGIICGLLTSQYLAVNDDLEATQSNSVLTGFHEEVFCDVVSVFMVLRAAGFKTRGIKTATIIEEGFQYTRPLIV